METMYEKLMTLPVFNGVGAEQLSSFLEKTHLEFNTYEEGEIITSAGTFCRGLTCLLSGNIEMIYPLSASQASLVVHYNAGKVIGIERLFGMDNGFGYSVKALASCGTMSFSKEQYMALLQSNNICMINFLNYLCYRAQRIETGLESIYSGSLTGRLATIIGLLTDRDCTRIILKNPKALFADADGNYPKAYADELNTLSVWNLIHQLPDGNFDIPSRSAFIDYAQNLLEA